MNMVVICRESLPLVVVWGKMLSAETGSTNNWRCWLRAWSASKWCFHTWGHHLLVCCLLCSFMVIFAVLGWCFTNLCLLIQSCCSSNAGCWVFTWAIRQGTCDPRIVILKISFKAKWRQNSRYASNTDRFMIVEDAIRCWGLFIY